MTRFWNGRSTTRPGTPLAQKRERAKLIRHFDRLKRQIATEKPAHRRRNGSRRHWSVTGHANAWTFQGSNAHFSAPAVDVKSLEDFENLGHRHLVSERPQDDVEVFAAVPEMLEDRAEDGR